MTMPGRLRSEFRLVQIDRWIPRYNRTRRIDLLAALRRIAVALQRQRRRARSRQQLGELSDHLLKDIGLDRATACHEAARPFWR